MCQRRLKVSKVAGKGKRSHAAVSPSKFWEYNLSIIMTNGCQVLDVFSTHVVEGNEAARCENA